MQQNSLVLLADQQQHWIDEETGITRWSLSPASVCPELIKVEIPSMGQLTIPASANEHLSGQTLWMLSGSLDFRVNHQNHHLQVGDCLALTFASENNHVTLPYKDVIEGRVYLDCPARNVLKV
ncbi:hypothetical protein ERYG_05527 [Escherichia coli M114]|nr:hypothetical protein ERYG_05527 [Escherichia coli M114]